MVTDAVFRVSSKDFFRQIFTSIQELEISRHYSMPKPSFQSFSLRSMARYVIWPIDDIEALHLTEKL